MRVGACLSGEADGSTCAEMLCSFSEPERQGAALAEWGSTGELLLELFCVILKKP